MQQIIVVAQRGGVSYIPAAGRLQRSSRYVAGIIRSMPPVIPSNHPKRRNRVGTGRHGRACLIREGDGDKLLLLAAYVRTRTHVGPDLDPWTDQPIELAVHA